MLILRPEPGASATAARVAAMGWVPVAAPLFTVVPVAWDAPPPEAFDAVMLTSANAARHAGPALARYRSLPAYAVGEATAAAARAAGFTQIETGDADAAALLERMAADGIARALHLAGREHRASDHPAVSITRRIVYAADAVAKLPTQAEAALAGGAVALLHSPRAASLLAGLVDPSAIAIAAISPAAAHAAGPGWRAVAIAATPDDAALLAAAAGLCD